VDWSARPDLHWKIRGLNSVSRLASEDPWTEQCGLICIGGSVAWTVCLDLHWKIRGLYNVSRFALEDPWTEQCGFFCIGGSVDWTAVVICVEGSVDLTAGLDLHCRVCYFVSFVTKLCLAFRDPTKEKVDMTIEWQRRPVMKKQNNFVPKPSCQTSKGRIINLPSNTTQYFLVKQVYH